MKERKNPMLILSAVFVALVAGIFAAHANQSRQAPALQESVKKIKVPTTEKERKHSQLLAQSQGRRISELTTKGGGDINLVVSEPLIMLKPGKEQETLPSIQTKVCNADAIVVGTLGNSSPQLTVDESFLFTEYTMNVEELIKNNHSTPIQWGDFISVVRDGGVGQFNGRTVRAKAEGFEPFVDGKRYILFLRFIPDTGSYLAYANGSFELNSDTIIPLGKLPENISREARTFLSATRAATAKDCASQQQNGK